MKEKGTTGKSDERKRLVARRALPLFVRLGYDKVAFQDISEATGVPRTAIYRYYRTKRQIFDAAIFEVIKEIRASIAEIRKRKLSAVDQLRGVCSLICDLLYRERDFVQVIFTFVFAKIASGEDMATRVVEFTGGLKTTFASILSAGLEDGSIRQEFEPGIMSEPFFANFESAALKMLLGIEQDPVQPKVRMMAAIDAMSVVRA